MNEIALTLITLLIISITIFETINIILDIIDIIIDRR